MAAVVVVFTEEAVSAAVECAAVAALEEAASAAPDRQDRRARFAEAVLRRPDHSAAIAG